MVVAGQQDVDPASAIASSASSCRPIALPSSGPSPTGSANIGWWVTRIRGTAWIGPRERLADEIHLLVADPAVLEGQRPRGVDPEHRRAGISMNGHKLSSM